MSTLGKPLHIEYSHEAGGNVKVAFSVPFLGRSKAICQLLSSTFSSSERHRLLAARLRDRVFHTKRPLTFERPGVQRERNVATAIIQNLVSDL